jgi:hypothetical protein
MNKCGTQRRSYLLITAAARNHKSPDRVINTINAIAGAVPRI